MKKILISLLMIAPMSAMAQQAPSPEDARYLAQASQQTASELTSAVINLRATVAKLTDENTKLRAELAKVTPAVDPPK